MRCTKRVLSAILAAAMVLSLVACGEKEPEATQGNEGEVTAEVTLDASDEKEADAATYTETSQGYGGEVTAKVTLDASGKVVGLEVTADKETESIGGAAVEPMVSAILAAGNADVDGVSGATLTSNAIKSAVWAALVEGGFAEGSSGEVHFTAGTYEGSAMGRGGMIHATVEVSDSQILSVTVTGDEETAGISDLPMKQIPQDVMDFQSLGVDAVTGATLTSFGVINAVSDALEKSGVDMAALRDVPAEKSWESIGDQTTQVVVVGGGISGLTAALAAADEGAQVILLEKMPYLGGSLLVAAGGFVFLESETKTLECDDSAERVITWARELNDDATRQPNYDFVAYGLRESGKTIDWLTREHNLVPAFRDYVDTPRATYEGGGAGLTANMEQILLEKGVTILKNSVADSVIMEDGKAVGVTVKYPGGDYIVHGDKIIMATGGDTRDVETLTRYTPGMANIRYNDETNVGNTGDGYRMLREAGAQMADGLYLKSAFPVFWEGFRFTWRTVPRVSDTLVVDKDGIRFAAEAKTACNDRSYLNWKMIERGSEAYWVILDGEHCREDLKALLDEYVDENNPDIVLYADTIEELAQKTGMDEATFVATFDKYQQSAQAGVDEEFGKNPEMMIPFSMDKGFYAARIIPSTWGSFGGAITDWNFHVLDNNEEIIPNLFGVGEVAGSEFFGDYYMGGFSLGLYAGAARVAAETATAEINAQQE